MGDLMKFVAHVKRSETGLTKLQVTLPIGMRAGIAEASQRLNISQLAIIRAAISSWLLDHGGWEAWDRPPAPTSEAPGPDTVSLAVPAPVSEPEPPVVAPPEQIGSSEPGPTIESEMDPELESVIKEVEVVPPKRARAKRGNKLASKGDTKNDQ